MHPTDHALIASLKAIDESRNAKWFATLDDRKKAEAQFHDDMRDQAKIATVGQDTYEQIYSNKRFYRTVELSRKYFYDWIARHGKDKVVLDFACGDGRTAIAAAKSGARLVIGIDISEVSVANARKNALAEGVADRTYFLRADCERTEFPDNSVDVVICAGVLHHLDLSFVFPEIRRILAPGGRLIAHEALDYNPLIKLYRMRTPHLRTEWEKAHILSLKDVRFASRFFDIGEVRYWHLTSILGVFNARLLPVFDAIDRFLTRIPGVKQLAWIFTFELVSNKTASQQSK